MNTIQAYSCFFFGIDYMQVKDYKKAVRAFKIAIKLDPENVIFLRKLAITYCLLNKLGLCVATYIKCLNFKPVDFDSNLELALVYLHDIQNYNEAAIYLQKCIQLNPDRIELYEKLFSAYKKAKDNLKASDACVSMGDLYLKKDDYENARNSFCCAVLVNPRNASGHWKLGKIYYKLGRPFLALLKYRYAIRINPILPNVWQDMAAIFDEHYGRLDVAIACYEMTIKLNPEDTNAQLKLKNILMKQMDLNNATPDTENQ